MYWEDGLHKIIKIDMVAAQYKRIDILSRKTRFK
jgi:hypothetical protein